MSDNTYKILHFKKARVIYPENENILAKQTYENFAQGINKTLGFFELNIELPLFNIFITQDRKEYDSFVSHLTAIPTSKSRYKSAISSVALVCILIFNFIIYS